MCTTDIFPFVNADGSKYENRQVHRCSASRHGQPCQPEVFKHATRRADASTRIPYTDMPPSPRYTPRTSTPVYQSGTESERSNKSNSSNKKRRSGIYVNGTKVLNLNKRRNERIVIVDSPPTPRTPPQTFNYPHTAPPSPNMSGPLYDIVDAPHRRESLRPVIVDERPRPHVKIEVVDNKSHRRHHSSSSHNSNSDSERRRRRDEEERAQEEVRRQRIRARILRANEEIEGRQPIPYPIHRASTYVRPGVEVTVPLDRSREQELVDAVRQLNINRRSNNVLDEDAAQRERLRERQLPRRRATVGPGNRRHRVMYDDGTYRWE